MPLVTYEQTRPWAGKMAAAVEMKMMPPWFADPRYGNFCQRCFFEPGADRDDCGVGRGRERLRAMRTTLPAPQMERRMEYSAAGCRGEDAEGGADSGAR